MSVCGADSCLFVDKKMINEGGNFVYILYTKVSQVKIHKRDLT